MTYFVLSSMSNPVVSDMLSQVEKVLLLIHQYMASYEFQNVGYKCAVVLCGPEDYIGAYKSNQEGLGYLILIGVFNKTRLHPAVNPSVNLLDDLIPKGSILLCKARAYMCFPTSVN